jgi:hypothetical protein
MWTINGMRKAKMTAGRPKKPIDYELVERLSRLHCTQVEIAEALGLSVDTLQRDDKFCGIYKRGIEQGRASLRRLQWDAAENGDKTMLVWLGKQYLGQRDKQDVENTVKMDKSPVEELLQSIDSLKK